MSEAVKDVKVLINHVKNNDLITNTADKIEEEVKMRNSIMLDVLQSSENLEQVLLSNRVGINHVVTYFAVKSDHISLR
jgi:hypothetical protein